MTQADFALLTQELDWKVAFRWFERDVTDDFFRDPIDYADLIADPSGYLSSRKHRLLQVDMLPHERGFVPKKSKLLREAVCLHPTHRLLYLAILRHFLHRIDHKLTPAAYSYRPDDPNEPDAYPFSRSVQRWKVFVNAFREAALEPTSKAVLITDIASYYDHIHCEKLTLCVESLLGPTATDADKAVLRILLRLLKMWSTDCFSIPQNVDPSSWLASAYLHPIDAEISAKYRMFRYVDDIRIVTGSEEEALEALHALQQALAQARLFLATDKTQIIVRGTAEFDRLVDVADDLLISQAEEVLASGDCARIQDIAERLFERLEFHSTEQGDDKKFRAIVNRLLDASDFVELREQILPRIADFVMPRLVSHPERSDYWAKVLAAHPGEWALEALDRHLVDRPSPFAWQRFHLWRLALELAPPLPSRLVDAATAAAASPVSPLVAAQAAVVLGKHGNNTQRQALFRLFTAQAPYAMRRAVLLGIQELPTPLRTRYFERALQINTDHAELVEWIEALGEPNYGEHVRPDRACKEQPLAVEVHFLQGIGLIDGRVTRFRLSRDDYGYD
jgi:hypothetical protein